MAIPYNLRVREIRQDVVVEGGAIQYREIKVSRGVVSSILILAHLALGFLTILLAVDDEVARGRVSFASNGWRIALGVAGAVLTYRAARALVRTINGTPIELSPDVLRRAHLNGTFLLVIGVGFLVATRSGDLSEHSVAFLSWARTVYAWGGGFVILIGLLQFVRPGRGTDPRTLLGPTSSPPTHD